MQDVQVTPFIYATHNVPLSFGFSSNKDHRIFSASIYLSGGALWNTSFKERLFLKSSTDNEGKEIVTEYKMGNFPIVQEGISVEYLHKVNVLSTNKYRFYFGGSIKQAFLLSFTVVPIFVVSEASINPAAYFNYSLSDRLTLETKVTSPLFGIMSRLPYSNDPADGTHSSFISVYTTGTKIIQPANFRKFDCSIALSSKLNDAWTVSYEYKFQWLHYTENRGIKSYRNQFGVRFLRLIKK